MSRPCRTDARDESPGACGEAVLAMCGGDTDDFVRLVGLGSAAGLLQQRDMFGAFQHMAVN